MAISAKYQVCRETFTSTFSEFQSIQNNHLGRINITKHRIELLSLDTARIHSAIYHAGLKTKEFEKAEIEKMCAENHIGPAQTEWAGLIVFVPRKDKTLRFCDDYSQFNAVTKRVSCPIPRTEEFIELLGWATVFSTADVNSEY